MLPSKLPRVFSTAIRPKTVALARTAAARAYLSTQPIPNNNAIILPSDEVPHTRSNPEGPMMGGYPEYLDDLQARTEKLAAHVHDLDYGSTVKWMDPKEIDALMDLAATHKRELQEQLQELQSAVQAAKTNYAVDAPDGECDGHLEDEMEEVNHIIDEEAAAAHHPKTA